MGMKIKMLYTLFAAGMLTFTACNSGNTNTAAAESAATTAAPADRSVQEIAQAASMPKRGDHVPSNLVCMVNDAYMGNEQIEVKHDGKIYYGCCEMCEERIPKDESVRYAIDPHTLEKVDKATAYIVMIGARGEVAYFENEGNFEAFKNNMK